MSSTTHTGKKVSPWQGWRIYASVSACNFQQLDRFRLPRIKADENSKRMEVYPLAMTRGV